MMSKIEINNTVWIPVLPRRATFKSELCLKELLNGGVLNRNNINELGIGAKNDSLHSLISLLRNKRFIPIISHRISDGTCNYFMAPEEIERYINSESRTQQRNEMKALIERKRQTKALRIFCKFLDRIGETPQSYLSISQTREMLAHIEETINALLKQGERR